MPVEFEISRKRLLLIIVIAAIIVGAILFFVFFNRPANWVNLKSWNGHETEYSMTTEAFTINGTEWRVNWQVSSYDNSSRCYVSVYDADTNVLVFAIPHEQQSGDAYFNNKGSFYLKVDIHGALTSWSVKVYQTA